MLKVRWRYALIIPALLVLAGGLYLWPHSTPSASIEHLTLAGVGEVSIATPSTATKARVILAMPAEQHLTDEQLLQLSRESAARLLQYAIKPTECSVQQQRLQSAIQQLDGTPTLIAGIGPGAALAWRWLAEQTDEQAQAISVDFSLEHLDCPASLPQQAAHGHWLAAWNDNPDDASARFVRGQPHNTQDLISDYGTSLAQLLNDQLARRLQGLHDPLPVIELPSAEANDTVTLFYSGDGGWRDLDQQVGQAMAADGFPVVGVDAMRYFWQHKSPEQASQDLSQLMQQYREKWGAKHFVLAGFSFGADVLPALYNRLPSSDQQQISTLLLIALARSGSFEIEVQGWLGKAGQEAPTAPELNLLPASKVLCVYGSEEAAESGCTQAQNHGENLKLPGGHHFDEDYPALATRLIQAIESRQAKNP